MHTVNTAVMHHFQAEFVAMPQAEAKDRIRANPGIS